VHRLRKKLYVFALTHLIRNRIVLSSETSSAPAERELETILKPFFITVRTATVCITFSALAASSTAAAVLTAEVLGDQAYGITVMAGVR